MSELGLELWSPMSFILCSSGVRNEGRLHSRGGLYSRGL